ncbi:MAG TPA: hypothetical protein VKR31_16205 [Rhizomicrobium sp.]|nr:hypothetical protein [Rhizomicrobium sp.]
MTRTLFLHVGPAKTGTSAVQHFLQRHDNSIVIYPKVGLWADGSHHNLILNYFGDYTRPEVVREDAAGLLARIGEEARRSDRDIVISSEILAGRRDVVGFCAALERAIGEPLRVEIVVVVREHFERTASAYNQRVKDAVTAEKRDPDTFLATHTRGLGYSNMLKRLRTTGFDLCALNYHPAEDCVQRVLAKFGFRQESSSHFPVRNASWSRPALVATLAANRVAASPEERNQFTAALRRMPGFHAPAGPIFGAEATFQADRIFARDRNFLMRRFGIELELPDVAPDRAPFSIDEDEFANIRAIASKFDSFGEKIIETVRPYLRT